MAGKKAEKNPTVKKDEKKYFFLYKDGGDPHIDLLTLEEVGKLVQEIEDSVGDKVFFRSKPNCGDINWMDENEVVLFDGEVIVPTIKTVVEIIIDES